MSTASASCGPILRRVRRGDLPAPRVVVEEAQGALRRRPRRRSHPRSGHVASVDEEESRFAVPELLAFPVVDALPPAGNAHGHAVLADPELRTSPPAGSARGASSVVVRERAVRPPAAGKRHGRDEVLEDGEVRLASEKGEDEHVPARDGEELAPPVLHGPLAKRVVRLEGRKPRDDRAHRLSDRHRVRGAELLARQPEAREGFPRRVRGRFQRRLGHDDAARRDRVARKGNAFAAAFRMTLARPAPPGRRKGDRLAAPPESLGSVRGPTSRKRLSQAAARESGSSKRRTRRRRSGWPPPRRRKGN